MDDESLDLLAAEVARKELREDQHTREQALKQFRNWILQNPDIVNCRTDDGFLLGFLRVRKFSVHMAQQTLVNFLRFQQTVPQFLANLDIQDPSFMDVMTCGYIFASPFRDKHGRRVIMIILNKVDMEKYKYPLYCRVTPGTMLSLAEDSHTQVFGTTYIVDFDQLSPAFLTYFPPSEVLAMTRFYEKNLPMRHKEVHYINLPSIGTFLVNLLKSAMSDKIQQRVFTDNSLEELHSRVDPRVLPKEYGGQMPMSEMIDLWKKELISKRDAVVSINKIKLQGESLKDNVGVGEDGIPDLSGSFRKLDVD